MTFSPVPSKPRVETLVNLDPAPVLRSLISIKPTPLPPFFPRRTAVKLPGCKVAKIAGSRESPGWKSTGICAAFVAVCQSSLVAITLPVESCSSRVGSCKGFEIPKLLKLAPRPLIRTCFGLEPLIINPAMATPSPAWTDTRVERLVVPGGSIEIAIPPAPPGTDATVIGTDSSPPTSLKNSTTELPNVTNKLPLESKAKSLTCSVVLVFVARVLTTPDGLISKMELSVGSVTKRFPEASNASLYGCPMPEANVVRLPSRVNFKIEL